MGGKRDSETKPVTASHQLSEEGGNGIEREALTDISGHRCPRIEPKEMGFWSQSLSCYKLTLIKEWEQGAGNR